MATSPFRHAVDAAIDEFVEARSVELHQISPDLDPLVGIIRGMLAGGKRMRATFVVGGWRAVGGDGDLDDVVATAAAIEIFHAAALVHDDIIDNSDTRRGLPAVHRSLEQLHRDGEWTGDPVAWARSAAILVGDLLLDWADDLLTRSLDGLETRVRIASRGVYARMRQEVTLGQYLDVLEEAAWIRQEPDTLLDRARTVAVFKSAKYSVEAPLLLGATIGGATTAQLAAMSGYGVPVGTAFQMRDDLLGVFGDPDVTGKPAGDDLAEGKRTVLVELARQRMAPNVRVMLDELLGTDLDEQQIAMLQDAIRSSGAVDRVEELIDRAVGHALEQLHEASLERESVLELERFAAAVTDRDS